MDSHLMSLDFFPGIIFHRDRSRVPGRWSLRRPNSRIGLLRVIDPDQFANDGSVRAS